MRIWRIGSQWGQQIDLTDIFKEHKLAFAGSDIQGQIVEVSHGDLLCITKGQSIEAIGKIEAVVDLATVNPSLAAQFDYVKALVLNELFFLKDFPFSPKSYGGQGKQFHEARGNYWKLIEGLYVEIKLSTVKMKIKSLLEYKKQIILQGPPGTGKTFFAKDLAEEILFGKVSENKQEQTSKLEKSGKFKLVQFHPSYTYDDFVRGIQADPESGTFTAVNKVFGEFCERALKNYVQSKPDLARSLEIDRQEWVDEKINEFADFITDQLDADIEHPLTEKAKIVEVNERGFRYQGNWSNSSIVPFKDLKTMYLANNVLRQDVKFQDGLNRSAFYHATYYFYLLEKFREFLNQNNFVFEESHRVEKDPETYIFIIDEINRANLPSVLGELIYALEYRDKPIESMYSLSNSGNSLIIPSNLLIIGTINTADRSVGHIDYAIRRRFAFVDVPPSSQPIMDVIKDPITQQKALKLFDQVSNLFGDAYLNSDFKAKEVQLGHSYFLAEDEEKLMLKLKYEIKPLLREYIKDGILKEQASKIVEELTC